MTDYVKVNPKDHGWLKVAQETISSGKPLQIYMSQETFLEIIKSVMEKAESNPFSDIVVKITSTPGVPPEVSGMISKFMPLVNIAASAGGEAGALLSVGGVVGYAALHGYEVEAGIDWHKLFDVRDDEAFIRMDPKP